MNICDIACNFTSDRFSSDLDEVINRALKNTKGLDKLVLKTGMGEVGLKFDFQNGWIQIVKIPEPPQPDEEMNTIGSGLDLHQQNT